MMNCPVCSTELRAVERAGIEVDICPRCKGVWLDRGELDKIIERSNQELRRGDGDRDRYRKARYSDDRYEEERDRSSRSGSTEEERRYQERRSEEAHTPRKKESFWSNLFDWD